MVKRASTAPKTSAVRPRSAESAKPKSRARAAAVEHAAPLNPAHARPARALIGWLAADPAHSLLGGPAAQPPYLPEILEQTERARAAVAGRSPLPSSPPAVTNPPKELAEHIRQLEAQSFYRIFLNEGWTVRMADLRSVRALQTVVHIDHAIERTRLALADDLPSLAATTIPISRSKELVAIESSPDGRRWTLTCRNPQLRILGPYSAELDLTRFRGQFCVFVTRNLIDQSLFR